MGTIVFNYKRCDNARGCPAMLDCQRDGKAVIYYDEDDKKIKVDSQRCMESNCESKICVKDCTDCFTFVESEMERWWAEEEIQKTESIYDEGIKDRYNSEDVTSFSRISLEECEALLGMSKSLLIMEVTSSVGCCSAYDSIKITDILPLSLYNQYYKKIVVKNEDETMQTEQILGVSELPAMVFYFQKRKIGSILGIYRQCEINSIRLLRKKIKEILLPYEQFVY